MRETGEVSVRELGQEIQKGIKKSDVQSYYVVWYTFMSPSYMSTIHCCSKLWCL